MSVNMNVTVPVGEVVDECDAASFGGPPLVRRVLRGVFVDLGHELVALAVHRPDDPLLTAAVADRLPDGLDPRRERRLPDECSAPDLVEQLDLGDHPLAVLDQVAQDVEDLRFDMDAFAVRSDLDAVRIDIDVAEGVDHLAHSCRSKRTSAALGGCETEPNDTSRDRRSSIGWSSRWSTGSVEFGRIWTC